MARLLLLCALAVGCAKSVDTPPSVAIEGLHGARPPAAVPLPAFGATAQDGTARGPEALRGQPTVLWFFPAANTAGCTVEGCGYRDRHAAFQAHGVQVIGVSFSDLQLHASWAEAQGFPYELWRDDAKTLALHYGAASSAADTYARRRTRLLDADGQVLLEYNDKIIVGAHPEDVLEDVRKLFPQAR